MNDSFDVIVVGGGHAGCEAAAAACRFRCRTLLLAIDAHGIGAMSCNPAIGGVGKGHIVREVDVLGGLIARAADDAAIHYRMLNRSKGVAVHGPRVQADRTLYRAAIRRRLAAYPTLTIAVGEVTELVFGGDLIVALKLRDGREIGAGAIVLATGTFLGGRLFRGEERFDGGRLNEPGAHQLARQLRDADVPIARLKTGTPPRLDGRTIDWSRLERQPSDAESWTMSPNSPARRNPQTFCGIARTNLATHEVIRLASHRSPLFGGSITGRGPRYCPSIEDKVVRFGDRDGHQVFLEPETLDSAVIYPNGLSTSLPSEPQAAFLRTIAGLETVEIVEPGYAVEYDHVDPRWLRPDLSTRQWRNLFLAGQLNGTTGYEEAAGQGLVAGANAAATVRGSAPIVLGREQSYIGIMIDDLTTQGVSEPYRMLTARAEHRLALRADNAEARLESVAIGAKLVGAEQAAWMETRRVERERLAERLRALGPVPDDETVKLLGGGDLAVEAVADRRYAPYVERQAGEVARRAQLEIAIPDSLRFASVAGLSAEMIERLDASRPATLGQASRLPGVTPAALTALLAACRRRAA